MSGLTNVEGIVFDGSENSLGLKMEELDVVFVEDWSGTGYIGQEQVIAAEQLTNDVETFFIEVTEDSVAGLPVQITKETDHRKTLNKRKWIEKSQEETDGDLSWLIGFKLDGLMNNGILEDGPNNDAKKSDQSQTKPKPSDVADAYCDIDKKPPFTYTELIECALQEKGPLTVSEIYQWISETFPYYKTWDDRWKNSVRHNLSINPYFRKGNKAKQGSGHLWTVSNAANCPRAWQTKRQRFQEFEAYTKRLKMERFKSEEDTEMEEAREAEIAAAIIEDKENCEIHLGLRRDSLMPIEGHNEVKTGGKKKVTVEFIDLPKVEPSNDFLNPPVSKEVLMGECGFFSQIELNLTAETEHLDSIESEQTFGHLDDELGFQFSDVSSHCPQLCL